MTQQPGSAYFLEEHKETPVTHTFSVVVDNEPGVLARIAGLFSGRGYNIESLTVSETEHDKTSRASRSSRPARRRCWRRSRTSSSGW